MLIYSLDLCSEEEEKQEKEKKEGEKMVGVVTEAAFITTWEKEKHFTAHKCPSY
jgi:hypothetical protein